MNLSKKQKETHRQKTNLASPKGKWADKLGIWDQQIQTTIHTHTHKHTHTHTHIYIMPKQGPTVYIAQGTIFSISNKP